ncbi:MAG: hypothetical protein G01um101433_820 [Parcubacteria group bacterium Gr01-1014_33]|nr:MAG: hypothetical protein G01um101433_820 [Parcubacteria group bacterium Gr01-1014_33]
MKYFFYPIAIAALIFLIVIGVLVYVREKGSDTISGSSIPLVSVGEKAPEKTPEERIAEAKERSSHIKGLYMTADVANDQGAGATRLRDKIIQLAETTEINGIVIDVKEVCGPDYSPENLKKLIDELHQKNIWAIARIAVFKDASQIEVHPEWYLTRKAQIPVEDWCARKKYLQAKNPAGEKPSVYFWRDTKGGYWLDPASDGARHYIAELGKKMIDLGFDELQFDYIRFPSDGDTQNAIYPVWDKKTPRHEILKSFFEFLNASLKSHKPEIIMSADLFGYVATQREDLGIGQRLQDIGNYFDYTSFMVYPSHYYSGLVLPADPQDALPAVNLTAHEARAHPDTVVYRSLLAARNFLDGKTRMPDSRAERGTKIATSTQNIASTTSFAIASSTPVSGAKLRPWLEDFFHEQDKAAKRPYGAEKVRLQIDAAQKAEPHGWMLWNAANVYTEEALRKE